MEVLSYEETMARQWDDLCHKSWNATFLHTRKFLSYHGSRFVDESVLIVDDGKIIGAFPAARDPRNDKTIVSHPGITYGGIIHCGKLRGSKMLGAFELLTKYYSDKSFCRIVYKAVPQIYHAIPSQDDCYALFRFNAIRSRCDLSCAIDLKMPTQRSDRRKRCLKKGLSAVRITEETSSMNQFWKILQDNLFRRHAANPTHDLREIKLLISMFPENIKLICAELDGRVEAGTLIFVTKTSHHAQYIASSPKSQDVFALDVVFDKAIASAKNAGASYFDFGISNEDEGRYLNEGLYKFKSEFGGGGVLYEHFSIAL